MISRSHNSNERIRKLADFWCLLAYKREGVNNRPETMCEIDESNSGKKWRSRTIFDIYTVIYILL